MQKRNTIHFLILAFFLAGVLFLPDFVFAMDPPAPTLETLKVFKSSSRDLGTGDAICTGISLTVADECEGILNEGSTYRFEAVVSVLNANFDLTVHDFEDSVGAGKVLGTIESTALLVGCVGTDNTNNTGTPTIESGTIARGSGYTGCRITSGNTGTVYWIITIDTDAADGPADATFYVTNGSEFDPSTLTTFNVTEAAAPPTLKQVAYKWFQNDNSAGVGWPATINSAVTAPAQGTPFRLRLLFHVDGNDLDADAINTRLEYSVRSDTCDIGWVNESYGEVFLNSGDIRYYDNSEAADGDDLIPKGTGITTFDPRHSTTSIGLDDTVTNQDYEESNDATSTYAVVKWQDALWDYSLVDFSAPAGTPYCFRVVQSGGGVLTGGYSVVPEITTAQRIKVRLRGTVRLRVVRLF